MPSSSVTLLLHSRYLELASIPSLILLIHLHVLSLRGVVEFGLNAAKNQLSKGK